MNNEYKIEPPCNLAEEEQIKLLREKTKEARNKLISSNIRLVIYEVHRKFNNTIYDIEDLISVGTIGLIKGIDNFDINKNNRLSTYLVRCIDNEILMFLRNSKQHLETSLNEVINKDRDGNKLEMIDILPDEFDLIENIEISDVLNTIKKIIYSLEPIQQQIIILNYGIDNNERLSQREIGKILNMSQPQISKILKKTLQQIKTKIENIYIEQEKNKKNL